MNIPFILILKTKLGQVNSYDISHIDFNAIDIQNVGPQITFFI